MAACWWGALALGGLFAGLAQAQEPEAAEAPVEAPAPPEPPVTRTLSLVYAGGAGGLGLDRYQFGVHTRLAAAAEEAGRELAVDRPLHGVFHQGDSAVWGVDETVASTVAFLEGDAPACEVVRTGIALRTSTERVLLPPDPGEALSSVPDTRQETVVWQRCTSGEHQAFWVGPEDAPEPEWDVRAFDVRVAVGFTLSGDPPESLYVLGMPRQEAARRARALLDLLSERPGAAFVDAGNFVPGASSIEAAQTSLHRPTGFDLLQRLHPVVLVPSARELAPGPRAFLREASEHGLTYVATNWHAEEPDLALPKVVRRRLRAEGGEVDAAFLGVVDPAVAQEVVAVRAHGVELLDPVASVQVEVDRLALSDDPPDVVVLLALVSPALEADLRRRLHGVDLHLGDRTAATFRVASQITETRPTTRLDKASPITLPMDGILVAELEFGPDRLERVRVDTVPVTADSPTYAPITAAITRVRAEVYQGRDQVLVPAPEAPMGSVEDDTLDALVCRAVLEATGADTVFLPPLTSGVRTPGPLTELQVSDRLALLDVLEEHRVDGDRMRDFLLQVEGEVQTHCGASVGERFPKVRGFYVDSHRTYRVVTTERARTSTNLGRILSANNAGLVLQLPTWEVLRDDEGQPLPLAAVALDGIRAWREAGGQDRAWVDDVLARSPATRDPIWLFAVDRLSLHAESFRRSERPEAYDQVPETLINSPNSFTVGADADLGIVTLGPNVSWDARFRTSYARLQVSGETSQETADDWRASSSITLPVAGFTVTEGLRMSPYTELLFDSEYTPLTDSDGVTLPRQADLSLTAGLSANLWRWIRALRLGVFLNQDMARLDDKGIETGGKIEAETRHDLLRASSVRVQTRWQAEVFADTPQDDAADLRFRGWGEVRLQLRLIRWLDAALYAQGLVAQGRVPETRQVVASTTFGAAVDMSSAFRLSRAR